MNEAIKQMISSFNYIKLYLHTWLKSTKKWSNIKFGFLKMNLRLCIKLNYLHSIKTWWHFSCERCKKREAGWWDKTRSPSFSSFHSWLCWRDVVLEITCPDSAWLQYLQRKLPMSTFVFLWYFFKLKMTQLLWESCYTRNHGVLRSSMEQDNLLFSYYTNTLYRPYPYRGPFLVGIRFWNMDTRVSLWSSAVMCGSTLRDSSYLPIDTQHKAYTPKPLFVQL